MLRGKTAVVTGGASGIGRALCLRLAAEGAHVVVADRDAGGAARVAAEIGGRWFAADVARAGELEARLGEVGAIDVLVSNAGVAIEGGPETADDVWQLAWDVHLMAHVRATRAVLPGMLARGGGILVATASAAGLLTNLGAAPYAVSKHAAVAFAEWLAVTYGDRGIQVHCLCPMGVRTPLLDADTDRIALTSVTASGPVLDPADVADATLRAIAERRFLVLPHPEVGDHYRKKAADPDRWIAAMQRLRQKLEKK